MSETRETPAAGTEIEEKPQPGLASGGEGDDSWDESADAAGGPPSWPENWRSLAADGNEKLAKRLERYATPQDWAKAYVRAENRIQAGRAVAPEPPDGATDIELRDWRKQVGIPETPDGYGIAFPETVQPSENDKAELGQFMEFMHSRNVQPSAAQAAFEFYMTARAANAAHNAELAEEATRDEIVELRRSFPGREYGRNISIANQFLNKHFEGPDAQDQLAEILDVRMSNGVKLSDYAPFVKALVNMARTVASEEDLLGGDGAGGGQSIDQEFHTLTRKPNPTREEWARMEQLAEARERRAVRNGRGA